jgi:hypothetical protein
MNPTDGEMHTTSGIWVYFSSSFSELRQIMTMQEETNKICIVVRKQITRLPGFIKKSGIFKSLQET